MELKRLSPTLRVLSATLSCLHTILYHSRPIYTIIYYNRPLYTIIYYNRPWYTIIYYNRPLYTTIHYNRPLYAIIYYNRPLPAAICYNGPLHAIIYYSRPLIHYTDTNRPGTSKQGSSTLQMPCVRPAPRSSRPGIQAGSGFEESYELWV